MEKNELAYEELLLSIDTSTDAGIVAFELVANCELTGSETGDAYTAMQRLINKYQPKTTTSFIQMKKEFDSMRLESSEDDPDEFITKLEGKRNELNRVKIAGKSEITETDLVLQVLTNLTEDYEVAISALETRMNDPANTTVTITDVRDSLNTRFSRMKQQQSRETLESKYEKALTALEESRRKPYNRNDRNDTKGASGDRGKCYKCGERGHYAKDCKQRPNETQHELARLAIGELGEYDSDNESINELGFFAMEHIGGDELQGGEIIVEETKNEPYGPEIIDCHDGPGESELVQNDATTNSFQQFFGKGVTSAADSAKKLGEINNHWTNEYVYPTHVRRMSSSDDEDSDANGQDVIASNQKRRHYGQWTHKAYRYPYGTCT